MNQAVPEINKHQRTGAGVLNWIDRRHDWMESSGDDIRNAGFEVQLK